MVAIVLLPGMDGSGSLFDDFIAALPPNVEAVVVKYPPDVALDYSELEVLAKAALPTQRPFLLVGESFSGPIAVSLAASNPAGLRGVVLVCSFVRSPIFAPRWFQPLLSVLPVRFIPVRLAAAVLLGQFRSPALCARLRSAIARVRPEVWQARLRAVLSADVTMRLAKVQVPVLYLRAAQDRVVPRSASELISHFLPKVRVVELESPHFLLQARPTEAAAQVHTFAREVGFAF
jgi:pimeloyl-[acyl-carrier protein] methyl ester esterase